MAEEYNSIERTLRTLKFQPVDRVPVDLHNFMLTPKYLGVTDQRYQDYTRGGS